RHRPPHPRPGTPRRPHLHHRRHPDLTVRHLRATAVHRRRRIHRPRSRPHRLHHRPGRLRPLLNHGIPQRIDEFVRAVERLRITRLQLAPPPPAGPSPQPHRRPPVDPVEPDRSTPLGLHTLTGLPRKPDPALTGPGRHRPGAVSLPLTDERLDLLG